MAAAGNARSPVAAKVRLMANAMGCSGIAERLGVDVETVKAWGYGTVEPTGEQWLALQGVWER